MFFKRPLGGSLNVEVTGEHTQVQQATGPQDIPVFIVLRNQSSWAPPQGPAVRKGQKIRESTSLALGEHGGWTAGASRALGAAASCVLGLLGRPPCRCCLIIHNTPCLRPPPMVREKLVSIFHLTIICKGMTLIRRPPNIRNLKFTKKDLGLSRSNIFKGEKNTEHRCWPS